MDKNNIKICYIGGGSRNWAWVLLQDIAFERDISGTIELYDLDFDAAQTNEAIGNKLMIQQNSKLWKFHANPSLPDALTGSDFVFISILPADFEEMAIDVHAPEKYGIYQPVGDTSGIGGIIRSMRAIPQFRHIAREIQKYAPNAWVVNYTNPMAVCTRTLYKEFPRIKAFGCCHEVFHTQKLLAAMIEDSGLAPHGSIKREEIKVNVLGINHFTWIDNAEWNGTDLFPLYKKFVEKYGESGFKKPNASNEEKDAETIERLKLFGSCDRVKMDLFRRYGLIAAAGDRHLAEFCPHSWYLSSPKQVTDWGFALTPVSWRIKDREILKIKARAYRDGIQVITPVESEEEGIKIIKALMGLGDLVTNVNLSNNGQMPDFPKGVVLETNAVFSNDNIKAITTSALPVDLKDLVMHHVLTQEGIVEAMFENDIEKAFRVFSHDYAIQKLSLHDARTLFDHMCKATKVM